ncbi:MAG: stage III sporulation protein AC [Oscillospiraceae bacterium]|nr:stage III sporulation protein AC [Oscillospiraceae bacterium]
MELDLIFKIAGVGIIVAVLSMLLKKADRDDYAMVMAIAGLIIVLAMIVNEIAALFETVKTVFGF